MPIFSNFIQMQRKLEQKKCIRTEECGTMQKFTQITVILVVKHPEMCSNIIISLHASISLTFPFNCTYFVWFGGMSRASSVWQEFYLAKTECILFSLVLIKCAVYSSEDKESTFHPVKVKTHPTKNNHKVNHI